MVDFEYNLNEILNELFHKHNINHNNLIDSEIFLCSKDNNQNQIHIKFCKNFFRELTLYYEIFKNYIFVRKDSIKISFFGIPINIIETLIESVLDQTTTSLKQKYYINMSLKELFNENHIVPLNKEYEFEFIKKIYNSTHEECPVCYLKYNDTTTQKINLNCHHCICKICYSNLLLTTSHNCPVCRTTLII